MIAAGIDGCRGGWVAAVAIDGPDGGRRTALAVFADAAELVAWRERVATVAPVAIDMPIGLPATAGPRACDRQARARLGPRWMSVFAPPDRELFGLDFSAAGRLVRSRRAADPAGHHPIPTHQTVNITPKVAELDAILEADPGRARWLIEVSPELSFRAMAGHDLAPKRSAEGAAQRRALLTATFADAGTVIEAASWPRRVVGLDDLADAYAALWSALRVVARCALVLGDGRRDAHGLPMRITV